MAKENGAYTYSEIHQQDATLKAVLGTRQTIAQVVETVFDQNAPYDDIIFTGCGTSLYLAQSAAWLAGSIAGLCAKAVPCSELYYTPEVYLGKGCRVLVLPITRKSVTTEVRMAIDRVRGFDGVTTLSITCDEGSKMYNDHMLLAPNTEENSVVMTRSFTGMLYLVTLLCLQLAGHESTLDTQPAQMEKLRALLDASDAFAKRVVEENPALDLYVVLGQGALYGVANESMNKMKEMGIVNSEAYYSLEYRHGPMSLADSKTLILLLANGYSEAEEVPLMRQMKDFGAVTAVLGQSTAAYADICPYRLELDVDDTLLPVAAAFAGQLMGYYIAVQKGIDADTPRNLSQAIVL